MLKKGWDVEGSPFKGQAFDPSMFDIPPGAVQFWRANRILILQNWLEWRANADFVAIFKKKTTDCMSQSFVFGEKVKYGADSGRHLCWLHVIREEFTTVVHSLLHSYLEQF